MTIVKDDGRFFSFINDENLFVYDAHIHRLTKAEIFDTAENAFTEYHLAVEKIPDVDAPDLRSRNRISNLKLSLSGHCNLACSYCFRHSEIPELSDPKIAKSAIDLMVNDFGSEAKRYTISFNLTSEPFLQWRILEELISHSDQVSKNIGKPIDWYVLTNGTIFNDETDNFIKNFFSRTKRLSISLDGPQEIHDANRKSLNGKGTHQQVLKFIDKWRPFVVSLEAQATLTSSVKEPLDIIEYLLDLGFQRIITTNVRQDRVQNSISEQQIKGYDRLFARLNYDLKNGRMDLLRCLRLDHSLRPLWKLLSGIKIGWRCYWGHSHVVTDGLGRFYPCDSVIGLGEFQCGDILSGVDWDVFHRDLSTLNRDPCKNCWARYVCGGTCYVSGIKKVGDPKIVDPYECSLNKYLCIKNLELFSIILEKPELEKSLKQALFS